MKGKLMKHLIALALLILCMVPANADQPEFMPFDFTGECLPLVEMANHLGGEYGQIPLIQSKSWIEVDERAIAGGLLIAVNPVTGSWTQIFVAPGQIACILSYGTNLQINGELSKLYVNPN